MYYLNSITLSRHSFQEGIKLSRRLRLPTKSTTWLHFFCFHGRILFYNFNSLLIYDVLITTSHVSLSYKNTFEQPTSFFCSMAWNRVLCSNIIIKIEDDKKL